jgi:hypothetical protein
MYCNPDFNDLTRVTTSAAAGQCGHLRHALHWPMTRGNDEAKALSWLEPSVLPLTYSV